MNKKIMNIVNFVRGIEPRGEMGFYLSAKKQIETNKKFKIQSTFLLQYDAMLREDLKGLFLKERDESIELGVWFENCRALIEKIGEVWRGREGCDWDWHVNAGFLLGYTLEQRRLIIDEVFRLFKEIFGDYPKVVGSWLIDAYSLNYICEKYGAKAFCVCREQYGVDAYTLWGGYSSGGYYASKNNMICPAQTEKEQIPTPIFRMLGADPIYNYDEKKYYRGKPLSVWTMEPAWECGRTPEIMDWYFDTYYKTPCLAFSQATTGQENPFGWDTFGEGYLMQIKKLAKLQEEGVLVLEKLGDTGESFKKAFTTTPPQVQVAVTDWNGNGIKSAWYNSKNYRANVFFKDGKLFFRDLNKYDEKYEERYLRTPCEEWSAIYDTLPLMDSRLWSTDKKESAILVKNNVKDVRFEEKGEKTLKVDVLFENGEKGEILFSETAIHFKNICLEYILADAKKNLIKIQENRIYGEHNGYNYSVGINGEIEPKASGWAVKPINGEIEISFAK